MLYEEMCGGLTALLKKPATAIMLSTLLTVLCCVSCKTQKNTYRQTTTQQTNERTQTRTQTDSTAARTIDLRHDDRTAIAETRTEQTEVTDWSAPDSLGRQYPLRTSRTTTTTRRGQRNDIQTTVTDNRSATTHTVSEEQTDTQQDTQTKTDSKVKTETTTPSWVIWLILGIIAALTIIVLIALKHYHII